MVGQWPKEEGEEACRRWQHRYCNRHDYTGALSRPNPQLLARHHPATQLDWQNMMLAGRMFHAALVLVVTIMTMSVRRHGAAASVGKAATVVTASISYERIVLAMNHPSHLHSIPNRGDSLSRRHIREIHAHVVHLIFDRGIRVNRLINDSSILDDAAFFPEASENAQGLTELICQSNGEHIVLESVVPKSNTTGDETNTFLSFLKSGYMHQRIPTDIFLPVELININEPTRLVASLALNLKHIKKHSSKDIIGMVFQEADKSRTINNLKNCSLHFLPLNEQKCKPYGQYENGDGVPFIDKVVSLEEEEPKTYSLLYPLNKDVEESIESSSRSIANYDSELEVLALSDERNCHPLPHRVKSKEGANSLLEVGAGVEFFDEAISDILPQLIKNPIIALLMPILKLLGVFGGDKMMTPLEDNMSQMTDGGLTGELAQQVAPKLIMDLQQGLPPGVQAAAPETITEAVATMMQVYIKESLLADVPTPTATRIAAGLARSHVPEETSDRTSFSVAKGVTRDTVHTLTRALTHTIVPAISHTVTHNPMQDYYCYYCFKHKAYCQYCSYSPQQLYYNMYYAGFYSTYFGDYYAST